MNISQETKQESRKRIDLSESSVIGLKASLQRISQNIQEGIQPFTRILTKRYQVGNLHKLALGAIVFISALFGYQFIGSKLKSAFNETDVKGTSQQVWSFETLDDFNFDPESFYLSDGSVKLVSVIQKDGDDSESSFEQGVSENLLIENDGKLLKLAGDTSGSYISREIKLNSSSEWNSLEIETQKSRTEDSLSNGQLLKLQFDNPEEPGANSATSEVRWPQFNSTGSFAMGESYNETAGDSLSFSGSIEEYLISSEPLQFNTDSISTSFWINTRSQNKGIISYATSGDDNEWLLYRPQSLAIYRGEAFVNTQINLADGQWHHVVVLWEGSSGSTQVYVDGAIRYDRILAPATEVQSEGMLVIGTDQDQVGGDFKPEEAFIGNLDDIMIWNRTLSSAEVLDLYETSITSLKYQIRGCDTTCENQIFTGPDGTSDTAYPASFTQFKQFLSNKVFQYKLILESEQVGYTPKVYSVSVGPQHYGSDDQTISTKMGVEYEILTGMSHQISGGDGEVTYQVSPDGDNWYYWNGVEWKIAVSNDDSNQVETVDSKLKEYTDRFGPGLFYFKAIFKNDPLSNLSLDSIQLDYSPPKGARVGGAVDSQEESLTEIVDSDFEIESYDYLEIDDELVVKGFVTENQKITLYSPDGETLFTDRVQGKWEINLPNLSERLGSGQAVVRLIAQNEAGDTTAYENLAVEIAPEIPTSLVVALVILSVGVTAFLIFTILRDKKSSDEKPVQIEPMGELPDLQLENDPADKAESEVQPNAEESVKVAKENNVSKVQQVIEPVVEEKMPEKVYTIEDYIKDIEANRAKELSEKDRNSKETNGNGSLNSRKALLLKQKRRQQLLPTSPASTEKAEEDLPIMKSLVALGAYHTTEPIVKKEKEESKNTEKMGERKAEPVEPSKESLTKEVSSDEDSTKSFPNPTPFSPGSRRLS